MLIGWFGLTTGIHAPTALNFVPAQAAIGGVLAALSGALTAGSYSWFTTRALNPLMVSRGFAAGLVVALAGAEAAGFAASRDFVLENMSGRMADQLREEIDASGKVKPADAEAAMSDVVAVIRQMEQSGDLLLVVEDEPED